MKNFLKFKSVLIGLGILLSQYSLVFAQTAAETKPTGAAPTQEFLPIPIVAILVGAAVGYLSARWVFRRK